MLRLLALIAPLATSLFAAPAASYDGRFTLDVPSGLIVAPAETFAASPVPTRPYIALEQKGKPLPVLLVMQGGEGDPQVVAERELKVFKAHNAKDPSIRPSKHVRPVVLKGGTKVFWFSDGRKAKEYSWIYVPFQGRVLKAGCPAENRTVCQGILNTIKPVNKPGAP